MALLLKESTAVDVLIGPFVDKTDGATAETGESPSVKLSKNGQTLAAKNDVTTPVHDADGYYNCELDATDTNTVGTLVLTVAASANALPVRHEFYVVETAIYDAIYASGAGGFDANGRVDVGSWLGTAVTTSATTAKPEVDVNSVSDDATAANNLELDYDGTGYNKSNSTIGTTTTNTDMRGTDNAALASVLGALADVAADGDPTTGDTVMQYVKQLINILIGTAGVVSFPAAAAPGNAVSLAEIIRAIYDDTNEIQVDTNALNDTKIPDTLSLANINAEVDTALVDANLDHLVVATGTVETSGSNSSTQVQTDLAEATDDHYNNMAILFISGAEAGQARLINDYVGATGVVSWLDALTGTPADAVAFVILPAHEVPLLAATQASIDAIETDTNSLNDTKVPDTISLANINAEVDTAFTTQMADSVATDGSIATREQALYMILQTLTEFVISGTTLTVRKVDGSTSLMTFTLSDDTNPTSLTRSG